MRLFLTSTLLALVTTLASTPQAHAQDTSSDETSTSSGGSIEDLLGSIPEIEGSEVEETEAKPPPDLTFPQYTKAVNLALLEAWSPKKKALKDPRAETQFTLKIDNDGVITGVTPLKLSGDKHFDQSCLDAISAIDRVPGPPDSLRGSASEGLVVKFPAAWAIRAAQGG